MKNCCKITLSMIAGAALGIAVLRCCECKKACCEAAKRAQKGSRKRVFRIIRTTDN